MLGRRTLGGVGLQRRDVMELIQDRGTFPCCSRGRHTSKILVLRNPFLYNPASFSYCAATAIRQKLSEVNSKPFVYFTN